VKTHYYREAAAGLRAELTTAVPRDTLRELHRKSGTRHLVVAARQFLILGVTTWALVRASHPLVWIPLAIVQGFTIFNFTILLHEVLHHLAFERGHPRVERVLALLYAIPSGISASQFTRWHLDHHAELGSSDQDPKRHHLSPKVNMRWYKLLYCTPALFPIYFRVARRENATYPPDLRRRIAVERRVASGVHLACLAALWIGAGAEAALRTHVFINSNYHLEHHYFPGVPFYHLPALQRALGPFYERHGLPWKTYASLVQGWIVENRAPHTNWTAARAASLPVAERPKR
jgi:fatty acid desaturase